MAGAGLYICEQCDYRSSKWLGRCPRCAAWATFGEPRPLEGERAGRREPPRPLEFRELPSSDAERIRTGIGELDRVLGGGLVRGAAVLIGGEPGVGKSTLLLQAAASLADSGRQVLYVSGEESAAQLRLRGDRLGLAGSGLLVLAETDAEAAIDAARSVGPDAVVVDSVQALRCPEVESLPGSIGQVREVASRFVDFAKRSGTPVLFVGQVTKDGSIAGPRALEHIVDAVIQFEGDRHHEHRLLRAIKNRFGPTEELGVFRMAESGLAEVPNPGALFVQHGPGGAHGAAVLPAVVGSRPLMVEVQALVGQPIQGTPRRTSLGVDPNRLAMILAVLQLRGGVELTNRDVFVNAAGGVNVAEPAADLAVGAAVVSSALRRPVPAGAVLLGEIGLTGELRPVSRIEARLREARRLGYDLAVVPEHGSPVDLEGIEVRSAATVESALEPVLGR